MKALFFSLAMCIASAAMAQNAPLDRTVLPLVEPSYPPITELDVRKAAAPPPFEVKAPDGATVMINGC